MRYIHNSYVNYALDLNLIALSTYNLNTSWLPALGNVIFFNKTNICPRSKASRANTLVLRTLNFQGATIRPIVPRHKHSVVSVLFTTKFSSTQVQKLNVFSTLLDGSGESQM